MKRFAYNFLFLLIGTIAWAADFPATLPNATSDFAQFNGHRVHYENLGQGKTALVYIHGLCGDVSSWQFQTPSFRDKIRQIAIDLPGHGKSDKPQIDYSMDHFARAVNAVLTKAGVDRAILVGFSMGTPVIRQFYRLYPQKVAALVLADGSIRKMDMPAEQGDKFLAQFSGAEADFRDSVIKFLDAMTATASAEVKESVKTVALKTPQHVVVSSMKAMFLNDDIWKEDPIDVPLLAIVTEAPQWKGYQEFLTSLAPKSKYRVITGTGHFVMMEKPDEFNTHLADFLKKHGWISS